MTQVQPQFHAISVFDCSGSAAGKSSVGVSALGATSECLLNNTKSPSCVDILALEMRARNIPHCHFSGENMLLHKS